MTILVVVVVKSESVGFTERVTVYLCVSGHCVPSHSAAM